MDTLSISDRKRYLLKIISLNPDSDHCAQHADFLKVKIELKNNSNDTLKYIDWSCSHEIWLASNSNIQVVESPGCYPAICQKNIIELYEINPKESKEFIKAYLIKGKSPMELRIKIGMILQQIPSDASFVHFIDYFFVARQIKTQTHNAVWSDVQAVPYDKLPKSWK
jgi:hypothetical protein